MATAEVGKRKPPDGGVQSPVRHPPLHLIVSYFFKTFISVGLKKGREPNLWTKAKDFSPKLKLTDISALLTYFQSALNKANEIGLAVEASGLRESSLLKQTLTKTHS